MGLEGWHRVPGLRVTMQGPPAHRAASLGYTLPALQGPPSPLPPSLFPRVGRGGKQGWPAENGKNQGASFPQWQAAHATSPEPTMGWRHWHQCAGQALEPHREMFLGQSPA